MEMRLKAPQKDGKPIEKNHQAAADLAPLELKRLAAPLEVQLRPTVQADSSK